MDAIDYHHDTTTHSGEAARVIVPIVLGLVAASSVLDVGAGMGDWLMEFNRNGIEDYMGIDGIGLEQRLYHADPDRFLKVDLREQWDLGRRFDLAICLEVAEHLPATSAGVLLETIAQHTDQVLFSAAVPHQPGHGHVNCQPPDYWQGMFNQLGFICTDPFRALIWNEQFTEFWYKQNLFLAKREADGCGQEPRLNHLIYPVMLELMNGRLAAEKEYTLAILQGRAGIGQSFRSAVGMILKAFRNV
jgi:hypothetical protein